MCGRRRLMARLSLLCAVTSGRSLPCRGLSSWKQPGSGTASWIQTSGRGAGYSMLTLGKQLRRQGSRDPTTAIGATWREGSHVRSVVTATAPEDVELSQPKPLCEVDEQQEELLRRLPSPRPNSTSTAAERKNIHPTATREFRPDSSKRMLMIPEEGWPRYPNFSFDIESKCKEGTRARTGTLRTPHGKVKTPAFIFCATKAAIKGLSAETMKECGSQIILSNTYHLLVQPGGERIEKMGGLQKATRWEGPMLTDSGGYQIFSMGHGSVGNEIKGRRGAEGGAQFSPSLVSIGEKGARFKSYHDCSIKSLTPERSIEIQRQLGADLVVVLDECTPFHVDKDYTASSMHRTHRWAMRSLREFIDGDDGAQALYGIVQGGIYPDLREEAAEFVNKTPFFGIAVGGSLGADKATMHRVVSQTMAKIRRDRPVHLLGIGGIADIFHGVRQGVDTFDCVHPTRLGRHGGALVKASFWEREREVDDEAERAAAGQGAGVAATAAAIASISKQNGRGVVATAAVAAAAVASSMAAAAAAAAEKEQEGARNDDRVNSSNIHQEGVAAAAAPGVGVGREERRKRRMERETAVRRGRYTPAKRQRIVPREHVNLLKGRFEDDHRPIDEDCGCPTCRGGYTRAYINHLGRAGELLGGMLVSQHNVFFMNELMTSIRRAIREGSLEEEEKKWLAPGLRSRDFHRTAPDASSDDAMAGAAGEGYEETED